MIERLNGTLLEKNPPQIVIDVNGVGYGLDVPISTFCTLPEVGAKLALFTHFITREDGQFLYGFATQAERAAFRQLIKISGVGARMALAVLSGLSVTELAHAIAVQDVARLVKTPGIGKKTAERLLLELRGKLGIVVATPGSPQAAADDVLNALLALGYSEKEAASTTARLDKGLSVEDGIRQALKLLAKG